MFFIVAEEGNTNLVGYRLPLCSATIRRLMI